MKKLLAVAVCMGCVHYYHLDISTLKKEEWCSDDCEKYKYTALIEEGLELIGYQTPWCICMVDCLTDSSFCKIDSRFNTNNP